ncbi:uncharacterized protein LOC125239073 [Leguminivora glycinivorella]|uniref:uncharacterized protein LOC125239073 n=1 Tax=Leguminivora glycinivorella TaxID=1035111 RepID=UPI00200E8B23|nr:uncharacterized protein LOC125239073 [Leguminivora glycinivorella]
MNEDSDLLICLDDEKEEIPNANNRDEEMRPIINKSKEDDVNTIKKQLKETKVIKNQSCDQNLNDDYIQVIDDEDDYEQSVQKLISAANRIGKEAIKSKQLKEAKENILTNDSQIHKSKSTSDQITDHISMYDPRSSVQSCLREKRIADITSYKPIYEFQHVTDDIPYRTNENPDRRTMEGYMQDVRPLNSIQTARNVHNIHHDIDRSEDSLTTDEHYPTIDRHGYAHRSEIPLSKDFYPYDPINRNPYLYIPRNTNSCKYNAMPMDTHDYLYMPQEMLSRDEYRRAEMSRVQQFYAHRPDLSRLDNYNHSDIERNAYRPLEQVRSDDYGNIMTNGFPYSYYIPDNALDGYRKSMMSRHAYRPGGISIEDYERSLRNLQVYGDTYRPPIGLSLNPYRSVEVPHLYKPKLVNTDSCREPMVTRNEFYPGTAGTNYSYEPRNDRYRTQFGDANRNENSTLNLSFKRETINTTANKPRNGSEGENNLQTTLSAGNQVYKAPFDTLYNYQNDPRYRPITGHMRRKTPNLSVNKAESEHMHTYRLEVPIRSDRPDTVILSTKNIYHDKELVANAEFNALATSETICNNNLKIKSIQTSSKIIDNSGAALDKDAKQFINDLNKAHEEKVDCKINSVEKNSIRLLVVFFTRVKDLVKDTFPEFSKSLEKEIGNLGARTNSGRLKTDIQFICPLYCSVSTYSLPRFDNTEDDNTIEKHVNRAKICEVCSCIQNCYKSYRKKCFNIVSQTSESPDVADKESEILNMPNESESRVRIQTVICARQATDSNKIAVESRNNEDMDLNEELQKDKNYFNPDGKMNKSHVDKRIQDSLSVINFNLSNKNIENASNSPEWVSTICIDNDVSLRINTHSKCMEIEKPTFKGKQNKEEIIIDYSRKARQNLNENRVVEEIYPKDKNEAKFILSLSFNNTSNASTLKDEIIKQPDTVYTCHICSCTFPYFTLFVSHMQKEHNINEVDEDISEECVSRKCPFCGVYSKQKNHNEHVKRAHPEIFTHKEETSETEATKVNKRRKSMKRKFIFTCLVCHKNLKSWEVQRHREIEHKGLKIAKMFTKKLSNMD